MADATTTGDAEKRFTRQQRKKLARQMWSADPGLEVLHGDAAGIDIGSREHYVAVGPERDARPVRTFGCFTEDLHRMAQWLQACGVGTIAMQSTGVYWVPVYDVLEQYGFDVWLVNAQQTRSLPGRKSDVQESQWLLKLHTYGLLRRSFRPSAEIRVIRTCWRERGEYVQQASSCIQRMQKALTEMNVQLATVLSDLSGATGMRILRAIVAGERDGKRLAEFRDPHVKASEETIAKSLQGTWLPEQLSLLKRQLADWDHIQSQIGACDCDLKRLMQELTTVERATPPAENTRQPGQPKRRRRKNGKSSKNEPNFDLAAELTRVAGVDLTRIDGIKVNTVQTLIAEAGPNMSSWPTEHHFVSWIGLCPRNDSSGGKVLKRKTRRVNSRLATALRMAATTLRQSDSYLGAQFRRLRSRLGPPKAITAMAAKLARLVYRMLRFGEQYVDTGAERYEQSYREQQLRWLTQKAAQQGFLLLPAKPNLNPAFPG